MEIVATMSLPVNPQTGTAYQLQCCLFQNWGTLTYIENPTQFSWCWAWAWQLMQIYFSGSENIGKPGSKLGILSIIHNRKMTLSLCFPKSCSSLVTEYFLFTSLVASKQLCRDITFPISFPQLVKISAKNWILSELARPEPHKQVKVKNPSELLKCSSWYYCNEIHWQRKPLKVLFIF